MTYGEAKRILYHIQLSAGLKHLVLLFLLHKNTVVNSNQLFLTMANEEQPTGGEEKKTDTEPAAGDTELGDSAKTKMVSNKRLQTSSLLKSSALSQSVKAAPLTERPIQPFPIIPIWIKDWTATIIIGIFSKYKFLYSECEGDQCHNVGL